VEAAWPCAPLFGSGRQPPQVGVDDGYLHVGLREEKASMVSRAGAGDTNVPGQQDSLVTWMLYTPYR
jgi:hypothetical protein